MKTLKEIQDEVAKEMGFKSYKNIRIDRPGTTLEECLLEVCRRAQLECGKATLENVSEKVKSSITNYRNQVVRIPGLTAQIEKSTITSEENIVIIK